MATEKEKRLWRERAERQRRKKGVTPRLTAEQRLTKYMNSGPADSCWEWAGPRNRWGYGIHYANGVRRVAHRAVYEQLKDVQIPQDLQLDHLCRNPPCVNPAHLEPVTGLENRLRGEAWDGAQWKIAKMHSERTHCPQGHPYEGENLLVVQRSDGGKARRCRTCKLKEGREYMRRKRAAQ